MQINSRPYASFQDVPVLLVLFNRPWQTKGLIDNLRKIAPRYLYVSIDGPRQENKNDTTACAAVEQELNSIDWDCILQKRINTENLGCKKGPVTAISWFLEQAQEGIILEDDIRFDTDFFEFCRVLLDRYRLNPKISCICGYQFLSNTPEDLTYLYSRYPLTWGWATWRDRWQQSLQILDNFPTELGRLELSWIADSYSRNNIRKKLLRANQENHIWDFLWIFSMWCSDRYAVLPTSRITCNVGVEAEATHTKVAASYLHSDLEGFSALPWKSPERIQIDPQFDRDIYYGLLHTPSIRERFMKFVRNPRKFEKLIDMALRRLPTRRSS